MTGDRPRTPANCTIPGIQGPRENMAGGREGRISDSEIRGYPSRFGRHPFWPGLNSIGLNLALECRP